MEPLAPCVLWGSPPTLPNIHLVEVLPECGVLATASDAGVVLWKLPQGSEGKAAGNTDAPQHELELRPYALLFPPDLGSGQDRAIGGTGGTGASGAGAGDVVTALAGCAANPDEPTCIATAAASGSICVWQVSTGRCLRSSADVVDFAATCMQTLPDRRYVLCAGQACDLALVDLQQMAVAHRLQGHCNWIERVSVQRATLEAGVPGVSMSALVVSVCRDGFLRFWDLEHERGRAAPGMDGTGGGKYTAVQSVASLSVAALLPEAERAESVRVSSLHLSSESGALVVVTDRCARLFTCDTTEPSNMHCIGSFRLPDAAGQLAGGSILCGSKEPWRIALWTDDGLAAVYVPSSGLSEPDTQIPGSSTGVTGVCGQEIEIQPLVRCTLPSSAGNVVTSRSAVRTSASAGGRLLASAWATGRVVVWHIAEFAWGAPNEGSLNDRPADGCHAWATGAVEDGWPRGNNPGATLCEPQKSIVCHQREVSAAAIAAESQEWPLFSVRGYTDGAYCVHSGHFESSRSERCLGYAGTVCIATLPSDSNPLELSLHSSAVTEVKLIGQKSLSRLLLLSCSRDGSLCFWDVGERKLLATSRHHRGGITSLHMPPRSVRGDVLPSVRALGPHVCSVGEDNCVCVHSLGDPKGDIRCIHVFGGHPSAVTGVHWGSDDDSLVVQTIDGGLSIWLLETGLLERRLPSSVAADILARIAHDQEHDNEMLAAQPTGSFLQRSPSHSAEKFAAQTSQQPVRQAVLKSRGFLRRENRTASSGVPPLHVLEFDLLLLVEDIHQAKARSDTWWDSLPSHFVAAVSFLYPWGIDAELDNHLAGLQLAPPSVSIGLAVHGDGSAFTALFPAACALGSSMRRAVHLASSPALSLVILSAALLDVPGHAKFHERLMQLYIRRVLQQGDGAVAATEKLLVHFMRHWLHPSLEIRLAARGLFHEVVSCLEQPQRRQLARHLSVLVPQTCRRFKRMMAGEATFDQWSESMSKCFSFFCLSHIAVLDASAIAVSDSAMLTQQIVTLSQWHGEHPGDSMWLWHDYAAEVLGEGFVLWAPNIADPGSLVRDLFRSSYRTPRAQHANSIANVSATLVNIAVLEPRLVLQLLSDEALSTSGDSVPGMAAFASNVAALELLNKIIVTNAAAMRQVMDEIARIVVSTMSPALPQLRKACLEAVKRAIASMTQAYPMVSFHKATQRLAVGLASSSIAIFDLNSARRLLTLRGHAAAVSAVSFGMDGLHVASYAAREGSARCWHPAAANGHCHREYKVEFAERAWDCVCLRWTTSSTFQLVDGRVEGTVELLQEFEVPALSPNK